MRKLFVNRWCKFNTNRECIHSISEQSSAFSEDGVTGMVFVLLPETAKKQMQYMLLWFSSCWSSGNKGQWQREQEPRGVSPWLASVLPWVSRLWLRQGEPGASPELRRQSWEAGASMVARIPSYYNGEKKAVQRGNSRDGIPETGRVLISLWVWELSKAGKESSTRIRDDSSGHSHWTNGDCSYYLERTSQITGHCRECRRVLPHG